MGNPTVIGVDLTNEPHLSPSSWRLDPGGATWGDGSASDLLAIYEQAGNAIQAVNPGVLIIVEGVINETGTLFNGQAALASCVGDLTTAGSKPVVLGIPNKVVYSIHNYPVSIACETPDSGSMAIAAMNQAWGYLESQNIAPVWIGEMGASLDSVGPDSTGNNFNDEQAWAATLVSYLNGQLGAQGGPTFTGNQQGISTDWWAWGNLDHELPDGTVADGGSLRPAQYAVYSKLQYVPSPPSAPPTLPTVGE